LHRREAGPVQAVADLLQREAQLPQRQHLLQAGDVAGRVETVPRPGVQRRPQQAALVVVGQRADRQPRPPRQLPPLQGLEPHGDLPAGASGTAATTEWYNLTRREDQGLLPEKVIFGREMGRPGWRARDGKVRRRRLTVGQTPEREPSGERRGRATRW